MKILALLLILCIPLSSLAQYEDIGPGWKKKKDRELIVMKMDELINEVSFSHLDYLHFLSLSRIHLAQHLYQNFILDLKLVCNRHKSRAHGVSILGGHEGGHQIGDVYTSLILELLDWLIFLVLSHRKNLLVIGHNFTILDFNLIFLRVIRHLI